MCKKHKDASDTIITIIDIIIPFFNTINGDKNAY